MDCSEDTGKEGFERQLLNGAILGNIDGEMALGVYCGRLPPNSHKQAL